MQIFIDKLAPFSWTKARRKGIVSRTFLDVDQYLQIQLIHLKPFPIVFAKRSGKGAGGSGPGLDRLDRLTFPNVQSAQALRKVGHFGKDRRSRLGLPGLPGGPAGRLALAYGQGSEAGSESETDFI